MLRILGLGMLVALGGVMGGCASAPKTTAERETIDTAADRSIREMTARDPDLRSLLDQSAGYVVFPNVREGGFIVGGGGAEGVLYQHGQRMGYAELSRASVGALIGGQAYSEIVVLRDQNALDKFKSSSFDLGGEASAIALKAGAARATNFSQNGIAVFVNPKRGAMINVSLTGQRVRFTG